MDQSYSESDASMSPTQILERLQVLRQLQILQRGKLQKQRLQYNDAPEESTTISEIISQFSSSTSYNSFKNILHLSHGIDEESSPNRNSNISPKVNDKDLVDGVSILNLSQESEFIINSPAESSVQTNNYTTSPLNTKKIAIDGKSVKNQHIELDEMPVLTAKKDFEAMVLEKMKNEKSKVFEIDVNLKNNHSMLSKKKPFLRKGEGMTRFGLKKNDLVIQNTKALPWRRSENNVLQNDDGKKCLKQPIRKPTGKKTTNKDNIQVQFTIPETNETKSKEIVAGKLEIKLNNKNIPNTCKVKSPEQNKLNEIKCQIHNTNANDIPTHKSITSKIKSPDQNKSEMLTVNDNDIIPTQKPKKPINKHPFKTNKGKTWAAILTKEQDDFLRQLKQSDYYKNFTSPTKSTVSDVSCNETLNQMALERETAEQNVFELLENKVLEENFNIESSFFNRFLRNSRLECSGESTPQVFQKCLANNPGLLHIFPESVRREAYNDMSSHVDCDSEYTDCDHETCSSVSTCCSCQTVEETNQTEEITFQNENSNVKNSGHSKKTKKSTEQVEKSKEKNKVNQDDTVTDKNDFKTHLEEMNTKLIATSELLKERLRELEDEIETFRKENTNLTKMREEIEMERHKFYEEKACFEQKANEDKVMSEYFLAEEKEKLTKQKQMYERYVREMRGRLNKKEKEDVLNLKKEISALKDEIRMKDAKSTSTIARLRNQIKILEKEKKDGQEECEKLKKENIRIRHHNDTTRRLTNIKYLEEINRKLASISEKGSRSDVDLDPDMKYKAYEIEKQSRKSRHTGKAQIRQRAKSVPNLNVTSRYAKYFSQRDVTSQLERNLTSNVERWGIHSRESHAGDGYHEDVRNENVGLDLEDSDRSRISEVSDNDEENNLEKIYTERFKSMSPESTVTLPSVKSDRSFQANAELYDNKSDTFFITKSNNKLRNNPIRSNSPHLNRSNESATSKSSINNRTSTNRRSPVETEVHRLDRLHTEARSNSRSFSPDSRNSANVSKTNLTPTEIKRPDGTRELRFSNGNIKYLSADGKYSKFSYYNGDVKETFYNEGRIKYFYAETKTYHTTHADGLEVLEFPDGQVEKRYKDGSSEIRLPNGSVRYVDPKNEGVREEWRFPDGAALTVAASGEQVVRFANGQVEVHAKDHKRREFPDGTVKLVYTDGTSETRYSSGRVRIKDKRGNLILDTAPG